MPTTSLTTTQATSLSNGVTSDLARRIHDRNAAIRAKWASKAVRDDGINLKVSRDASPPDDENPFPRADVGGGQKVELIAPMPDRMSSIMADDGHLEPIADFATTMAGTLGLTVRGMLMKYGPRTGRVASRTIFIVCAKRRGYNSQTIAEFMGGTSRAVVSTIYCQNKRRVGDVL